MSATATRLTSQDVPYKSGDNVDYQVSDMSLLTLTGMIGSDATVTVLNPDEHRYKSIPDDKNKAIRIDLC